MKLGSTTSLFVSTVGFALFLFLGCCCSSSSAFQIILTSLPGRHSRQLQLPSHRQHLRAASTTSPEENHPPTMEDINARLTKLGLVLPPAGAPKANYQLLHRDGDLLYLSGHLPMKADGTLVLGACAPKDIADSSDSFLTTEQGYEAAQHCALNLLSTLQSYMMSQGSDLSKVSKVIKLFGIVRSHSDFTEQHLVMNGASDVIGDVLGKEVGGSHARSAIGTNTLPLGIAVEVEMIAKISN
jgi:enamine deaminase RidA (YjgF/YER057c/UK114 family)